MPTLDVVGQQENPEVEPVVVPVAAYTIKTGKEVIERFAFRPTMPPGVLAFIERMGGRLQLDASNIGEGVVNSTLAALQDCLMGDERERWHEWIGRDDLVIEATTIVELFKALFEEYAERPTRPRSSSGGTGSRAKPTSKAAQPSTD